MKRIVLIALYSISFHVIFGQVTNGNRYNLWAEVTGFRFDRDSQDGTNDIVFLMDATVESSTSNDGDCELDVSGGEKGSGYSHSTRWQYDTPETRTDSKYHDVVLNTTNVSRHHYNLTWLAYEQNCGDWNRWEESCGFFSSDGYYSWGCKYWNAMYQANPGKYRTFWDLTSSNNGIRIEHTWRYYNGESRTRPLTFGTLNESDFKYHTNWNNRAASGASSSMGYLNNWTNGMNESFDESPDVTYSFSLSVPSRVYISTNYSTTDFDTRIHLVKKISSSQWELLDTNDDISGSNNKSVIDALVAAGDYFVVIEGDNGATGKFQFYIDNTPIQLAGGSIENHTPFVKDGCTITQAISNDVSATTSFGTFSYSWYKKVLDNNPIWELIPNATNDSLTSEELGILTGENLYVKRVASQLGITAETDSVYIELKTPGEQGHNGSISGFVTGKNGIGSIGDVKIFYTSDAKGECKNHIDSTMSSGEDGSYKFENLYYGSPTDGAAFSVWAEFLDHQFKPDTIDISIASISPNNDKNFEDTTSIFISGSVYQVDDDLKACGIPDISFYLNDLLQTTTITDDSGRYSLVITQRDDDNLYTVRPDTNTYHFTQSEIQDIYVIQDVGGINFENTRRDTIRGKVTGSCDYYFGSVVLQIKDTNGACFDYTVETDALGYYELIVPSREYTVSVKNVIPQTLSPGANINDIEAYLSGIIDTIDVTDTSAVSNFVYRQAPVITINEASLPTNSCGEQTDIVFYQGVSETILFDIIEQNSGGCPMDTGRLVIQDNISGRSENIELPIVNGQVLYEVLPGEPLLVGDHMKSLTATAFDIENPDNNHTVSIRAIVDGNIPQERVEQTVSPDIPMLILRDPPGDNSYSYFQKDSSTSFSSSFQSLVGGEVKVWKSVEAGIKIQTGIGVSTSFAATVSQAGSLSLATQVGSRNENISTLTVSERYETSSDDDAIGAEADIFVGGAFNISYGITDIIEYDTETCTINKDSSLVMSPDSLATTFAYTAKTIRGVLIPRFEQLKDLSSDIAEKNRYENQISVWTQMLDRNDDLKKEAISTGSTYTFGGDLSWEESTTESATDKSFFEFDLEINREIATSAKLETSAVDVEGGVTANFRYYIGTSQSNVVERATTVGYVLADDDQSDVFVVDVKYDKTYGTPVFETTSQTSSCPYTGGTKVDNPILTVTPSTQSGIDADSIATYEFNIFNNTQMPQGGEIDFSKRSYVLDIDNTSNPHGAAILVGGDGIFPLTFDEIPKGQQVSRDIGITRVGAPNQSIYAYEGLKFDLQPVCEDLPEEEFPSASVRVNAYFDSECSGINLVEPADGWIHNSDSESLNFHITGYDKSKITTVTFQYSKAGLNSWIDEVVLYPDDLNDDSTLEGHSFDWIVPDTLQGAYDIRFKLICPNGIIYSLRNTGIIDNRGPNIFGLPSPIDDVYDPLAEDQISISFDEIIICDRATTILSDAITGEIIPHSISCFENSLQIVPDMILEPSVYRVLVSGVEDTYQNSSQEYRWLFVTEGFDLDCTPINVSNNNLNQDAISQSVYKSMMISSDGTVSSVNTIEFKAEESVSLEPGFEVLIGGALIADIENCEE